MMNNLKSAACFSILLTACGCANSNTLPPTGACSTVDEAWMNTVPRCAQTEGYFHYPGRWPAPDCVVANGDFEYANSRQSSVPELSRFRAILGYLTLFEANSLENISGLQNLEHLGQFTISSAPLPSMRGLDNLRVVTTDFRVGYMPVMTSLDGLERLRSVGGSLRIVGNPQLRSLRGLESLCHVGGDVQINDNPLLPQSEIDAFLAHVEVGGEVILTNP